MKKLITLLCLLPLCSLAQKNEIGTNVGLSFNTNYAGRALYRTTTSPSFYLSLGYSRRFGNWQAGARYSTHSMKVETKRNLYTAIPAYTQPRPLYVPEGSVRKSDKAVHNFSLTFNRLFPVRKHFFYGGVNLGYAIIENNGFSYGVQFGDTYYVSDRLGLNAEIGVGSYNNIYSAPLIIPENPYVFSFSFGVRFRFDKELFKRARTEDKEKEAEETETE